MHTKVRLTQDQAVVYVKLALEGLEREFPNKPGVTLDGLGDLKRPREIFPVFYGHFDWHSSVHGHWTAVRLLRLFPEASWADGVKSALDKKFTQDGLMAEAEYLSQNPNFERMYGWAWALRLGLELREVCHEWACLFQPIEVAIVENAKNYLPKLNWPVRCGFHPESAFPLSQMLDWSRVTGDEGFENLIKEKAIQFYGEDVNYPVNYEPSGNDFFSAGLNEADLMRRVYSSEDFGLWLNKFLPDLKNGVAGNLLEPVAVSDLSDGHLVHLVGLNLSRAWAMRGIASALDKPESNYLLESSKLHEIAGLAQVSSGSYEGEHWLGTFAVYLMTGL